LSLALALVVRVPVQSGRPFARARAGPLVALVVVGIAALWTVRGYSVTPDRILVHRLLWATRLPRAGLTSATYAPDAMARSIRLFGNGGLFGVVGWFSNRQLGRYRAWVTDPRHTVVLRWADRTVVVSPSPPELFVESLNEPPSP
jgi:hypothetical protein